MARVKGLHCCGEQMQLGRPELLSPAEASGFPMRRKWQAGESPYRHGYMLHSLRQDR
jgi:hypothetical protein